MRIADIANPKDSDEIYKYARNRRLEVEQLGIEESLPVNDILPLLIKCIKEAKNRGCIEVCIKELRSQYNFATDMNCWRITILGFKPA